MKVVNIVLRYFVGLFLLMPVFALFGMMPEPTADMYSAEGWAFMEALMTTGYMMPLITLLSVVVAVLLFLNRTALAAIILLPFSVNVILFHVFLDESVVNPAASPAYILMAYNLYLIWLNRETYKKLW